MTYKSELDKLSYHESFILACLREKPLDREGILREYEEMVQFMGIAVSFSGQERGWTFHRKLESYLEGLVELGLVDREGGVYELTESGREVAEKSQKRIETRHEKLRTFLASPEKASLVSVVADAGLAVLKLAVGFLFNSMALVADGFDSSVDVFSSIAVYLGIKFKRELISTSVVISMMFATSVYIFYEAVTRLLSPEALGVSPLAIATTIASGGLCYCLSVYQHYVGKRNGSISLLTQSIDSRNHTFQAGAVLVGLVFAAFGIFIVDSLVALLVGVFILKSALELLHETFKLARGEELDAGRFGRKYERAFSEQRRGFFRNWILLTLRDVETRAGIIKNYSEVFEAEEYPISTAIQPTSGFEFKDQLDQLLAELCDEGLIDITGERIVLTARGKRSSSRRATRARFGVPF